MSTLTRYRPGYLRLDPFREFDALVRSAFGTGAFDRDGATGLAFRPTAETVRDGEDAVIRLEIPGVDAAEDVDIELTESRLVVRGERRDEHTDETDGRYLREIRYGRFERSFALPSHVTSDAVTATYDAGVLTIRVAGVYAGSEPTKIAISDS